jgi:hypothetical protein
MDQDNLWKNNQRRVLTPYIVLTPYVVEGPAPEARETDRHRRDTFELPRAIRGRREPRVRWSILLLALVIVGASVVYARYYRPQSGEALRGARRLISAAHGELADLTTLASSLDRQVEQHQHELARIATLQAGNGGADEFLLRGVSADKRKEVLAARDSRERDLIAALESRKDKLTEKGVRLLERIHRAEVELVRGEESQDSGDPVGDISERVRALLEEGR